MKERVDRGFVRRFEVYITGLNGETQDPDECYCQLFKQGMYTYDSPTKKFTCNKVGDRGYWGADIPLPSSLTLGDWLAKFTWRKESDWNGSQFLFTVIDQRRPYINRDPDTIAPNTKVVE